MRILRCLCLLLLLDSAPAVARDIFVDNALGDDRATGRLSEGTAGPLRTIAKALSTATSGDTIVLANTGTPYRECISLVGSRCSGFPRRPFTIRGNGAILDGSAAIRPSAWENHGDAVFRFRPPAMGYQQLFLDDRPATRVYARPTSASLPQLEPLEWCFRDGQIYFCVEPTKLPGDYALTYAFYQTGVTLYHVSNVLITDLTVQGYQIDGISLANSASHVSLVGVRCRGNGRAGVSVGGASMVEIERSLAGNNGVAQLLTLPTSETHIRNCHLLSNTAPGWVDQGGHAYFGPRRLEGGLDAFHPTADSLEKQP